MDNVERVNLEIPNAEYLCDIDGILECPWQFVEGNAIPEFAQVAFYSSERRCPTPTMAQCYVACSLPRVCLVEKGFLVILEAQNSGGQKGVLFVVGLAGALVVFL